MKCPLYEFIATSRFWLCSFLISFKLRILLRLIQVVRCLISLLCKKIHVTVKKQVDISKASDKGGANPRVKRRDGSDKPSHLTMTSKDGVSKEIIDYEKPFF